MIDEFEHGLALVEADFYQRQGIRNVFDGYPHLRESIAASGLSTATRRLVELVVSDWSHRLHLALDDLRQRVCATLNLAALSDEEVSSLCDAMLDAAVVHVGDPFHGARLAALWGSLEAGQSDQAKRFLADIIGTKNLRDLGPETALSAAYESIAKVAEEQSSGVLRQPTSPRAYLRKIIMREAGHEKALYGSRDRLGANDLDELRADRRAASRGQKGEPKVSADDIEWIARAPSQPDDRAMLLTRLYRLTRSEREREMLRLIADGASQTDARRAARISESDLAAFKARVQKSRK